MLWHVDRWTFFFVVFSLQKKIKNTFWRLVLADTLVPMLLLHPASKRKTRGGKTAGAHFSVHFLFCFGIVVFFY